MFASRASIRTFLTTLLVLVLLILPAGLSHAETATNEGESVNVAVPADEKAMLELLLQVKQLAGQAHPSDVTTKAMYEGMLKGLMESLGDPHSEYMTADEYVRFTTSLNDSYSGIGVVLQLIDGQLTVVSIVKGGPAAEAGMEPGDIITSVDGKEPTSLNDAASALRGPAGTHVIVIVHRPSTGEIMSFGLVRQTISSSAVQAKDIGEGLFYIDIDQFDNETGATFGSEIDRIKGLGAAGLLLDLRDNPGGLLNVGVEVADHLVPKGPIVELQGTGKRQIIFGEEDTDPIPVVLLVNGRSASASEIVAGALRDYGVGFLVGERTYGKGSIQQVFSLGNDLGAIRLTIANYYTPAGTSISGTGLAPDLEVVPDVTLPSKLEFTRLLRDGLVGLDVLALQESLSFLGYYTGEPDGVFGPRTELAVAKFLGDQGNVYSGSVGSAEVDLLNSAAVAKVSKAPDTVYLRGLEVLRYKVQTGAWAN